MHLDTECAIGQESLNLVAARIVPERISRAGMRLSEYADIQRGQALCVQYGKAYTIIRLAGEWNVGLKFLACS